MSEGYWITTEQHAECEAERERLRAYVGTNYLRSDYKSADHMREEIGRLRAELASMTERIECLRADARRWQFCRAHWASMVSSTEYVGDIRIVDETILAPAATPVASWSVDAALDRLMEKHSEPVQKEHAGD